MNKTDRIAIAITAIVTSIGIFIAHATVSQENWPVVIGTNGTVIATNNISETGYFQQIIVTLPAGVTSATFAVIDQITGTNYFGAKTIVGKATIATNCYVWTGSNVLHGAYSLVTSSVLITNPTTATVTITNNILEVK